MCLVMFMNHTFISKMKNSFISSRYQTTTVHLCLWMIEFSCGQDLKFWDTMKNVLAKTNCCYPCSTVASNTTVFGSCKLSLS